MLDDVAALVEDQVDVGLGLVSSQLEQILDHLEGLIERALFYN